MTELAVGVKLFQIMSCSKDLLATVSERLFHFLLPDEKMKLYRKPEANLHSEFHSKTFCKHKSSLIKKMMLSRGLFLRNTGEGE